MGTIAVKCYAAVQACSLTLLKFVVLGNAFVTISIHNECKIRSEFNNFQNCFLPLKNMGFRDLPDILCSLFGTTSWCNLICKGLFVEWCWAAISVVKYSSLAGISVCMKKSTILYILIFWNSATSWIAICVYSLGLTSCPYSSTSPLLSHSCIVTRAPA